ncbi:MAG TPA: hypothetical protein VEL76_18500, partial [Gemmataceae bacterium]|nr:hypothetical protein [Gemmataceae bacterium]
MARPAIRYASVPTAKPVRPLGGKILTLAVFAASLALFILAWLALRGLGPQPEAATAKPNGTPPPDVPPVKLASGNQAPT